MISYSELTPFQTHVQEFMSFEQIPQRRQTLFKLLWELDYAVNVSTARIDAKEKPRLNSWISSNLPLHQESLSAATANALSPPDRSIHHQPSSHPHICLFHLLLGQAYLPNAKLSRCLPTSSTLFSSASFIATSNSRTLSLQHQTPTL